MASVFGNIPDGKKAYLLIKKKKGHVTLTCHFNPEKYTITRKIGWKPQSVKGQNTPPSEFQGGGPSSTTLNLLFDTAMEGGTKDVRSYTRNLWDATKIDDDDKDTTTSKGQPPHVVFMWGQSWQYEAVVTSLTEEFILFNESGLPIRSNITLGLTQIIDDDSFKRQNPTSGGIPGDLYTVREGDRLDLIANQFYNRPMMWRNIAEYNGIDNPSQLVPGQRLIIPPPES